MFHDVRVLHREMDSQSPLSKYFENDSDLLGESLSRLTLFSSANNKYHLIFGHLALNICQLIGCSIFEMLDLALHRSGLAIYSSAHPDTFLVICHLCYVSQNGTGKTSE